MINIYGVLLRIIRLKMLTILTKFPRSMVWFNVWGPVMQGIYPHCIMVKNYVFIIMFNGSTWLN